ncbi:MAG: COG1361 S-layer family protein [Nitrososphaerales archaeon]
MKIAVMLAVVLFAPFIAPPIVFAHYPHTSDECPTTEQMGNNPECLIEQRESGKEVKFVDIFFSEGVKNVGGNDFDAIPAKLEVEPGDGTSILAVVMANSGAFELTGMKGWLSLPLGFEAAGRGTGEPAFDTYDLGLASGAAFVFEFPVDVKENARVGMYNATLHVEYFKSRDIGLNFRDFQVEFLLPGKSVLDAVAVNSILLPSTRNNALIEIVNDGSASASGVIVDVGLAEGAAAVETEAQAQQVNQIVNVGKKVFNIGVIKPYSKAVIEPILYVNPALADTRQNLVAKITYFDAYGQRKSTTTAINFIVAGTTTESIDFMLSTDTPVIRTITETPFTVTLHNSGTETASSVEVTISTPSTATVALNQEVPEASKSPIMIRGGDGYTRIANIKPGETVAAKVALFASEEAVNTAFQLPVRITYLDQTGGVKQLQRFVSVYVQGTISLRVYDFGIAYIGNEPNISGYLLNEGTNLALFTTVELVDNQDVVKAKGVPQYLGDLTANSPLPFNIPVRFAEGTSAGNYPITIKVYYKDDLRIPFEFEIDGTVSYTPRVTETQENPALNSSIGVLIGVGAAGLGGYYYMRKKKIKIPSLVKKDKGKIDSDDDIDFLSDTKQ